MIAACERHVIKPVLKPPMGSPCDNYWPVTIFWPCPEVVTIFNNYCTVMIPVLKDPRAENHDTHFWENPLLGGILDFPTVTIPVLNGPRAENHDTNFRENLL